MDPALQELAAVAGAEEIEAIIKLRDPGQVPPHVRIVTRFGDVATCRLVGNRIEEVWAHPATVSLKAARLLEYDGELYLDEQSEDVELRVTDTRRPADISATGSDIVIGVVDWGVDVAHENLVNRDGSTRFLAVWDQRNGPSDAAPEPYGYGRVLTRDAINAALATGQPYDVLEYHPEEGDPLHNGAHGTHVLDIAAGSGAASGSPTGIAPGADLVFVHLSAGRLGGLATLGDSVRVLEALDFIRRTAGDRPWVANTSLGRHSSGHRGLSLVEQGMDAMLLEAPGRAIVQSCGNYYRARAHACGRLLPGQRRTLTWQTGRADVTPNELEIWYPIGDRFHLTMRPPIGNGVFKAGLGEITPIVIAGEEVGRIYHRKRDPTGEHHIDIFLRPGAPSGDWQVELFAVDAVDGRFDAYVERDPGCPDCQSHFHADDFEPRRTLGSICNGFHTIAVGAYDGHDPDRPLGSFSSSGPTRDGRQRPNLVAPGVGVLAARSAARDPEAAPIVTRKTGTSMAAPHVTGAIALMFEVASRPLWIRETHRLLLSTTDEAEGDADFQLRIGTGYLAIAGAMEAAAGAVEPAAESHERGTEMQDHTHEVRADVLAPVLVEDAGQQTVNPDTEQEIGSAIEPQHPAGKSEAHEVEDECTCGGAKTESTTPNETNPLAEQLGPDSPVANSFVEAHRTRYCVPGQAGSATCRNLATPRAISRVIVHVVAVPSDSRLTGVQKVVRNWQRPSRQASAHYLVDHDGTITQMVREGYAAFHTPGNNVDSIGVEHADVCNDPAPLTTELYERSAALVRDVSTRHGFTITNHSVSGHFDVNPNHRDPGPYWDWEYYRLLLAWDGTTMLDRPLRVVTTSADSSTVANGWRRRSRRNIPNTHCASRHDPYGSSYWRASPDPHGTPAELSLIVADPGLYGVSLWWPNVRNANSAVSIEINVQLAQSPTRMVASETVTVNQRRKSGRWNMVGQSFAVGSTPVEVRVRIRRDSAERGWIIADAMRVLKIGSADVAWLDQVDTPRMVQRNLTSASPANLDAVDRRWGPIDVTEHLSPTPEQLVDRAAEAVASADVRRVLGPEAVTSPALLFDSLACNIVPGLCKHLEASFDVVALPGESLDEPPRPGDMVVVRALGEGDLALAEVIVEECPECVADVPARVVPLETDLANAEVRHLTDVFGRLDHSTLILRPLRDFTPFVDDLPDRGTLPAEQIDRLSEVFVCTPSQVPDPDRKAMHPTIFRGTSSNRSRNTSVGHAQELLNRFLAVAGSPAFCRDKSSGTLSLISTGLTTLASRSQNPLVVDCKFGRSTKLATRMFQACLALKKDGIIGPNTWAFLELINPRPAPGITPRPCCILAPDTTFTPNNILDPTALGTQGAASEASGLVYCGKAGFFDLGHARDMIDLVKFIHDQLTSATPPQVIRTILGIVSIRRTPTDPAKTAAAIAFDDALGHEIVSWDTLAPGGRNSSFSPEDLVSNFLGTLVAERAIATIAASGGTFNATATSEMNSMLTSLDVQTKAESDAAFNLINPRWVDFTNVASLVSNRYLLRRNFTRRPFKTGHPSDAPTPAFVTTPFSSGVRGDYDYFHLEGGKVLPRRKFGGEIARIKREANAAFGPDFDKP